jgi:hypothetical protein
VDVQSVPLSVVYRSNATLKTTEADAWPLGSNANPPHAFETRSVLKACAPANARSKTFREKARQHHWVFGCDGRHKQRKVLVFSAFASCVTF